MTPRTLHIPTAIGAALVAAALANVAQFGALELETSDQYEAVRIKNGHDLRSLVGGHFGSTQERFSAYVAIREFAPYAVVGTTAEASLLSEQLRGLGLATDVRRVDTPQLTTRELRRLRRNVVAEGVDEGLGTYAVAVGARAVERLVLVRTPEITYIADVRLLAADPVGA